MNAWQLARQFKYLALAATWPGGGESVLGDLKVTSMTDEESFGQLQDPYALVNVEDAKPDDQNPFLVVQVFSTILGVIVEGGQYGEEALLGGVRSSGVASSGGRGLLEVEEEFLAAVSRLTGADGVNATCAYKSGAAAGLIQGLGYVNQRAYRIECTATQARYYHPPQNLSKAANTVSWTLPPDRFDRYKIILRRAAGSTPPASATAGTGVTLGSDLATSVTDVASTVAYSVWCEYDEKKDHGSTLDGAPSGEERYSDAATTIPGTTLVVA